MVTKDRFMQACKQFVTCDMIPQYKGNERVILRTATMIANNYPSVIYDKLKGLVAPFGIITEDDEIDIDALEKVLTEGLGSDEFKITFKVLFSSYSVGVSADDIRTIRRYAGG